VVPSWSYREIVSFRLVDCRFESEMRRNLGRLFIFVRLLSNMQEAEDVELLEDDGLSLGEDTGRIAACLRVFLVLILSQLI